MTPCWPWLSITVMALACFVDRSSLRQSCLSLVTGCAVVLLTAASFGCGKPFNVKTQPDLPPANYTAKAASDHVSVQAQAITDEDFLFETFDANLLLAGILPVRVMLTNSGGEIVNLKNARFEVYATAGSSFKAMNERQAFKRLISYYEISTYNKSGYKESLEAFSAYGLDTLTPLAGAQSRQGLVFFPVPAEVARGGLTLVVSRLDSASSSRGKLELKLN